MPLLRVAKSQLLEEIHHGDFYEYLAGNRTVSIEQKRTLGTNKAACRRSSDS
ncbi:hypothetical protein LCGC14_2597880, partial [marine sediment metagenome]